jgi:putative methyltransferase
METPQEVKERAANLSKFQYKILSKALTDYHSARFVVYSTCSIYVEENENVVRDVLKK